MAQKIDATTWTGLRPDNSDEDVTQAQRPVAGGPLPLAPVSYRERPINWPNAGFLIPMWATMVYAVKADPIDAFWFAIAIASAFILGSLIMQFWRSRPGRQPTITLDQTGLNMPYHFKDPIPWSKIGRIESSHGNWLRWTSVFFDKDLPVIQIAPWPLNLLSEEKRRASMPMAIISSWNMAVDTDELISELTRFRDNYCAT